MISVILAGLAAAGVAAAAVAQNPGTRTQPVRVRVKEVDEPAAKRVGAVRRP